jgi:hypothetical protein
MMETELLAFWKWNQQGWKVFRENPLAPELDEIRDDIEVMAEMAESDVLRGACQRCIRLDNELRIPLLHSDVA